MPIAPTALTRATSWGPGAAAPSARAESEAVASASAATIPSARRRTLTQPRDKVIADAERVGHDRKRGVDGRARREERRVDDVEVVDLVRAAVHVKRRRGRIDAEARGTVLMGDTGERD